MRIRKIAQQRGRDVCHGLLKPGIERAAVVLTGGVRRPKRQRELEAAAGHGGAIVRQDRETPVAVERHLELRPLVAEAKPELGEDQPAAEETEAKTELGEDQPAEDKGAAKDEEQTEGGGRMEKAEAVLDGMDTALNIASTALSVTRGVLKVGEMFPLIGPTCKVVSGGPHVTTHVQHASLAYPHTSIYPHIHSPTQMCLLTCR